MSAAVFSWTGTAVKERRGPMLDDGVSTAASAAAFACRSAMLTVVKRFVALWASVAFAGIASPAVAQPSSPQQLSDHVRRSVVAIERNGVPIAIGTVLDGDGRILTALSGVSLAESVGVRYADGSTVVAKVAHGDKTADLALLVPQSGKRTEGLAASEADPVGAAVRAMIPQRGVEIGPTEATVKGRVAARTRGGEAIPPVLDVETKGALVAGAPLVDATGSVVGVVVRECKGSLSDAGQDVRRAASPCTPVLVGAPVSAIRAFLSTVGGPPPAATAAWLGIRGEHAVAGAVHGVRVVAIAPASPAQAAALKPNSDLIVAVEGQPVDTPEKLADAIAKRAPGETVKLLVFSEDRFREVAVALRSAP